MNRKIFSYLVVLVFLTFLTMFPLTIGILSSDGSTSTTWGNIKTGNDSVTSVKFAPPIGSCVKLNVPHMPQVPPGTDWNSSMNCGQTSVLMCVGYLKQMSFPSSAITDENKWLAKTYNDLKYLNVYGYFTGGNRISYLENLARNYWGYKKSMATTNFCVGTDELYLELRANHPVVVEVINDMFSAPTSSKKYHFMVLVGMSIGTTDANSYVWVNDPAKTKGNNNQYSLKDFKKSWANLSNQCVFIR